jgi:hypothetical protein
LHCLTERRFNVESRIWPIAPHTLDRALGVHKPSSPTGSEDQCKDGTDHQAGVEYSSGIFSVRVLGGMQNLIYLSNFQKVTHVD